MPYSHRSWCPLQGIAAIVGIQVEVTMVGLGIHRSEWRTVNQQTVQHHVCSLIGLARLHLRSIGDGYRLCRLQDLELHIRKSRIGHFQICGVLLHIDVWHTRQRSSFGSRHIHLNRGHIA